MLETEHTIAVGDPLYSVDNHNNSVMYKVTRLPAEDIPGEIITGDRSGRKYSYPFRAEDIGYTLFTTPAQAKYGFLNHRVNQAI